MPTRPELRAALRAEHPDAAAVLAEAFEHDPVLGRIVPFAPGSRARLALLFETLILSQRPEDVRVDVAVDDGAILGAAVWSRPGAHAPVARELAQLPRFLRALRHRMPSALRDQLRYDAARPQAPHWYLGEIGVAESARGRGIGGALLAHGLERPDADGVAAYLESSTERNRALYRRHGFEERGLVPGLRGAVPMRMLRAAR